MKPNSLVDFHAGFYETSHPQHRQAAVRELHVALLLPRLGVVLAHGVVAARVPRRRAGRQPDRARRAAAQVVGLILRLCIRPRLLHFYRGHH